MTKIQLYIVSGLVAVASLVDARTDPRWKVCKLDDMQLAAIIEACTPVACPTPCMEMAPVCGNCGDCGDCGDCQPTVTPPRCPNQYECKKCKTWKGLVKCRRCTFPAP